MRQDDNCMKFAPDLCRAARALLDWTQGDLAERAQVSRSTIRDFEGKRHDIHRSTATQLRIAFETAGVSFIEMEGIGPGVCIRQLEGKAGT